MIAASDDMTVIRATGAREPTCRATLGAVSNAVALIALMIWLLGFLLRAAETVARPRRRRWYYW
jgi:hypothetical protein